MMSEASSVHQSVPRWEHADHHRVPYWLFQRQDVFLSEQVRLFRGPHWHYLGLEVEVASAGDYVTTRVGNTPVILVRDVDGELYGFENRCAHRGALLALENRGNVRKFTCVYHAWSYSLQGDLTDVAFKDGINDSGGMARGFCMGEHGTTKMRVSSIAGLVFGSFDQHVPGLEEYLGEEILARIERVLAGRTPVILGRYTQMLPNNWKLYMENVKDSYHASILHLFFTTFEINRLSQKGAIIVSNGGGHHVSWSAIDRSQDSDIYNNHFMRSQSHYRLADPSILQGFPEFGDDVTLQILTVFPGFVLQQIQNCIAIRQLVPQDALHSELNWIYLGFDDDTPAQRESRLKQANLVGPAGYVSMEDGCVGGFVQRGIAGSPMAESVLEMGGTSTDSSESRITEASVRGFWKAYRATMEL